MKYEIKNITGDPTNPNPLLRDGKKLYATSGQLQQLLPIDAQETAFISAKALAELTLFCPEFFTVLDPDGSADADVAHRDKITFANTNWLYYDLGKFAGDIRITNLVGNALAQFSLSGGTGIGVAPLASTISDVLPGETIEITSVMEPVRYIYLKGTSGQTIYVLVN